MLPGGQAHYYLGILYQWDRDFGQARKVLEDLVEVQGNLVIRDTTALPTLTGLDSIRSVGGNLNIRNNTALIGIYSLQNLSGQVNRLQLRDNPQLTSISALRRVNQVGENLVVRKDIEFRSGGIGRGTAGHGTAEAGVNAALGHSEPFGLMKPHPQVRLLEQQLRLGGCRVRQGLE